MAGAAPDPIEEEAPSRASDYRRSESYDLLTLTVLKLPPPDRSSSISVAAAIAAAECEVRSWGASKAILRARNICEHGTRGISFGQVTDVQRSLIEGICTDLPDPYREARINRRAHHALGPGNAPWERVLAFDPASRVNLCQSSGVGIALPMDDREDRMLNAVVYEQS